VVHTNYIHGWNPKCNFTYAQIAATRLVFATTTESGAIENVDSLRMEYECAAQGLGRVSRMRDSGGFLLHTGLAQYCQLRFISPIIEREFELFSEFYESYESKTSAPTIVKGSVRTGEEQFVYKIGKNEQGKPIVYIRNRIFELVNYAPGATSCYGLTIVKAFASACYYYKDMESCRPKNVAELRAFPMQDKTTRRPVMGEIKEAVAGKYPLFNIRMSKDDVFSMLSEFNRGKHLSINYAFNAMNDTIRDVRYGKGFLDEIEAATALCAFKKPSKVFYGYQDKNAFMEASAREKLQLKLVTLEEAELAFITAEHVKNYGKCNRSVCAVLKKIELAGRENELEYTYIAANTRYAVYTNQEYPHRVGRMTQMNWLWQGVIGEDYACWDDDSEGLFMEPLDEAIKNLEEMWKDLSRANITLKL
jgi:hypothetical protein